MTDAPRATSPILTDEMRTWLRDVRLAAQMAAVFAIAPFLFVNVFACFLPVLGGTWSNLRKLLNRVVSAGRNASAR